MSNCKGRLLQHTIILLEKEVLAFFSHYHSYVSSWFTDTLNYIFLDLKFKIWYRLYVTDMWNLLFYGIYRSYPPHYRCYWSSGNLKYDNNVSALCVGPCHRHHLHSWPRSHETESGQGLPCPDRDFPSGGISQLWPCLPHEHSRWGEGLWIKGDPLSTFWQDLCTYMHIQHI